MNRLKQIFLFASILNFIHQPIMHADEAFVDMPSANSIANELHIKLLEQLRKADLTNQYIGFMLAQSDVSLKNKNEIREYLTTVKNKTEHFQDSIYNSIVRSNNQLSEKKILKIIEFNTRVIDSIYKAINSKFKTLELPDSSTNNISIDSLAKQLEENDKKLEYIEKNIEYMGLNSFNIWYRKLIEKDQAHAIWASKLVAMYGVGALLLLYFTPSNILKYTNDALEDSYIKTGKNLLDNYKNTCDSFYSNMIESSLSGTPPESYMHFISHDSKLILLGASAYILANSYNFTSSVLSKILAIKHFIGDPITEFYAKHNLLKEELEFGNVTKIQHILQNIGITIQGLQQPIIKGVLTPVGLWLAKEHKEIPKFIRRQILRAKVKLRGGPFKESNSLLAGNYELPKETLDDVICCDHVKQTCIRLIEQCANPKPFEDTNKKIRGVLFVGPPRTGKTFTAKAICGEINKRMKNSKFKYLTVVSSDFTHHTFEEIVYAAEDQAPCILCIEEIDTLGLQKSNHQPSMKLLSDFLAWMSGPLETKKSKEVIVIGITNDPQKLDKALLQPGRFEIIVPFERPGIRSRAEYLIKQLKKYNISVSEEVLGAVVIQTEDKTLTDIDNIIGAVIEKSKELSVPVKDEFFEAVLDSEVRKIAIPQLDYSPEQKMAIAIYQAGKVLATHLLSPEKIIAKTTVYPVKVEIKENKELTEYFDMGGTFSYLPQDKFKLGSEQEILTECKVLLAGAEAQKILTGSYHFDHQAKDRQKAMDNSNKILLGGQEYRLFPNQLKSETVEKSIQKLQEMSIEVNQLLMQHKDKLQLLAETIAEKESLNQNEIYQILES